MEKNKANQKQILLAVIAVFTAFAVFAAIHYVLKPRGVEGDKTITVEIIAAGNQVRTVEIKTDSEFLRQALDEENLIGGEESEFGLFVKTVDGVTADDSKQEWWCFTKGGESILTGVDDTPIADGERYEITLVTGY